MPLDFYKDNALPNTYSGEQRHEQYTVLISRFSISTQSDMLESWLPQNIQAGLKKGLLTELALSRWLDIEQVLFFLPGVFVEAHKLKKKNKANTRSS